jgi:hypothetical protein
MALTSGTKLGPYDIQSLLGAGGSYLSGDGGAYAYRYMQVLSQVYVVRGMK